MKILRIRLVVHGYLVTPLVADTIFGHVVWGIARREGSEAASRFLSMYDEGDPPMVLSSAFPADHVPMPLLSPIPAEMAGMTLESYALLKGARKRRYVPVSLFLDGKTITPGAIASTKATLPAGERTERLHNTVDRFGNGTLDEVGLFGKPEQWYSGASMDMYVQSTMDLSRVSQLFEWAFESGYGARASTGAGRISVATIEEVQFPDSGNRAMALAPFALPGSVDSLNLKASVFARRGKVGYEIAATGNPFKKPILFYSEGSTMSLPAGTGRIGMVLRGVHEDDRIRQYGVAPVLRFEETVT